MARRRRRTPPRDSKGRFRKQKRATHNPGTHARRSTRTRRGEIF